MCDQIDATMQSIKRPITYQRRSFTTASKRPVVHTPPRVPTDQPAKQEAAPLPVPPPIQYEAPQVQEFKPDTSIVVPVMNESANIIPLISRIAAAVKDLAVEVLFVDDSRDQLSVQAADEAARRHNSKNFFVRMLHREGAQRWGGLSGAVTDGMTEAKSDRILVMDGDLQHPPETIPAMISAADTHDVVVASRYCAGGSAGGLDGRIRHLVSRGSTLLAKIFFPFRLKSVTDPMTGFFLIDKSRIDRSRLRPKGFKILLEILATHPGLTKAQVPLQFAERVAGQSNGSIKQGLEFFGQLLDLRFGMITRMVGRLPKSVLFAAIGGSVFVVGMVLLFLLVEAAGFSPLVANAIQLAVTFWLNYVLNRHITWRDRTVTSTAAMKFLASRAATSVINYLLFVALIAAQFSFNLFGYAIEFSVHYIVANIITLAAVMVLNYIVSDKWAFADRKDLPVRATDDAPEPQVRTGRRPIALLDRLPGGVLGVAALVAIVAVLLVTPFNLLLPVVLAASSLALFLQASLEAWRMMYSYRDPESIERLKFPAPLTDGPKERFCMIVPARHESAVLAHTLTLLAQQTHTDVDIISIICDDDHETLEVAHGAAAGNPRIQVMEYPLEEGSKPSKPKQLNYVLEQTTDRGYTVIGIIDAEDTVHPELLVHIEAAFNDPDVDIVQGGVQLMNHDSSWYALHNVLEYYRWFTSAMAYNADQQFMPLGGNTIFIRDALVRKAGGWPLTLTEDCSLGVLLSTKFNAKTAVYYDARLATREETPDSLNGLFKQRVRWNQGFFHEWRAGVWHDLPTFRQRLLAGYVLLGPLLMAIISIFMVISLLAILFLKAPVGLAMIMYLPLIPVSLLAILNGLFLYDFGKAYDRKIRIKDYLVLFSTQIFYQVVLNTAALWSVIRELRGDDSWYKTPHSGLHRDAPVLMPAPLQPAYAQASDGDNYYENDGDKDDA